MAQIAKLPQHLVNRIAAGEVVERPASVVKELMENSLDAGATELGVEIEDGGKKLIRICDNGGGIGLDQLELAVAPHATSKITSDEDLFSIRTMGFRGEALASIASISHMEILSRPRESVDGGRLTINGGDIETPAPAPAAAGTTISVRNLFFNTPARRKFLRTANTEMGHITEQFTRIALAHRHVQMTLMHNGRTLHRLPADQSLRERIAALFTSELAEGALSVSRQDEDAQISGLICPPQSARSGSQWQYVFLNGRYIRDRFVGHAVREAYRGMLEVNRQPVVFLFIETPPDAVDVNVHPAKIEVRFVNSNRIHSQILATIRDRLLSTDLSVEMQSERFQPDTAGGADVSPSTPTVDPEQRRQEVRQAMADFFKKTPATVGGRPSAPASGSAQPAASTSAAKAEPAARITSADLFKGADTPETAKTPQFDLLRSTASTVPARATEATEAHVEPAEETVAPETGPRPFVQIHDSYIVTETEQGLAVIDQHALHERIIYEQLNEQLLQGPLPCQRHLIPETVDVTPRQMAVLEEAESFLTDLGVVIERFGPNTVAVQGSPTILKNAPVGEFVGELLDLYATHGHSREELLHHILDMMACKAAVKAGDPLTDEEIAALLAQRTTVRRGGTCPHGRPTTITLSKEQLEKQFKRT